MRGDDIIAGMFMLFILGTTFLGTLIPIGILWLVLSPIDFWMRLATIFLGCMIGFPISILIFIIWAAILT